MGGEEGICPRQELLEMLRTGALGGGLREEHLQPSSIDLPLGKEVTRVNGRFLPQGEECIQELLQRRQIYTFQLRPSGILVPRETYIITLDAEIILPEGFAGLFNPKSTTGRGDLDTRVFSQGEPCFDLFKGRGKKTIPYLEATAQSNNTIVAQGLTTTQMRVQYGNSLLSEEELRQNHKRTPFLYDANQKPIPEEKVHFRDHGVEMTLDLECDIPVYRRRKSSSTQYDLSAGKSGMKGRIDEFWEPIHPRNGEILLEPGDFYLLATQESIRFTPMICGILSPYDVFSSEGRVHIAGFFDPGFGFGNDGTTPPATATLEYRITHQTPFWIRHGQPICVMQFHRMRAPPLDEAGNPACYGAGPYAKSSNYRLQSRGPQLPKQFL